MCRIAAYLGQAQPLSALLFDAPHGLYEQAYRPREQSHGYVNVDGTGVGWWPELGAEEPLVYVGEKPPWADPNLRRLAPRLRGALQLWSVRSATDGIPVSSGHVHPFAHGRLAFVHNGFLGQYRQRVWRQLVESLPDELYAEYSAVSDSQALFLSLVHEFQSAPEDGLGAATVRTLERVSAIAREHELPAVLNLFVADGERLVAVRCSVNASSNTLYVHADEQGVSVASEATDERPGWQAVGENSWLEVSADGWVERELPCPAPA